MTRATTITGHKVNRFSLMGGVEVGDGVGEDEGLDEGLGEGDGEGEEPPRYMSPTLMSSILKRTSPVTSFAPAEISTPTSKVNLFQADAPYCTPSTLFSPVSSST